MTTTEPEMRTHSIEYAAEQIGAPSVDWLLRRLRRRELPGRQVGRNWRMTDGDIARSIELLARPAIVAVPDPAGLTPGSRRRLTRRRSA
ncbi:DNA-binding protein [Nocardia sp. NPDC046763]|uniref:DNA-binding protein n=1 Tax=Nocardia sp. NPDC046763 TaxID=3155256 RepID=UPI0033F77F46